MYAYHPEIRKAETQNTRTTLSPSPVHALLMTRISGMAQHDTYSPALTPKITMGLSHLRFDCNDLHYYGGEEFKDLLCFVLRCVFVF